jgi:polyvinyl alcohol dehydrogenase (cytochrome)
LNYDPADSEIERSMNIKISIVAVVAGLAVALPNAAFSQADTPVNGEAVFNARCKVCHDPAVERAPGRAELAIRSRADIEKSLTDGAMAPMAKEMTAAEVRAVAAFLAPAPAQASGGQRRGGAQASVGTSRMCESHPPISARAGDWASAGVSPHSDRFQRAPELKAADVPKLKLKWAFTMPGGGQPTVVGDWLFMANRGKTYALDAKTGCVHWELDGASSRNTPMIVQSSISPSGWATFLGVGGRVVRAFDAQTGKELWRSEPLESHQSAGITGSPIVVGDQLFVPMSSGEEATAIQKTYPCCTFRGSLIALDLKTGRKQWQTYTITEPLRPTRKNSEGVQLQGPAGGAIWAAPSIDLKRGLVYVVTGDSYTDADTAGADAVMAIEMKTGKVRWSYQVTKGDNFTMACDPSYNSPNCPEPAGPDFDFGATPILFTLQNGKQVLVAGQKSALVYGFDPDNGKLLWTTRVGSGSALGGIEWGIAADDRYVYVPNADSAQLFAEARRKLGEHEEESKHGPPKPNLSALDPATGKIVWMTPAPVAPCKYTGDRSRDYARGECVRAHSAAASVMPGIVFAGTLDGWFRAYDSKTGKIVWQYSTTAQTYDTVNGVKDQPGGGIDGMGPTIAHGIVYTMSGFNGASRTGGNGNNVLLAFSVDGK